MKFIKNILFALVMVVGLSVGAMAQKGPKNPPPKGDPPKINVPDKPKNPPPRDPKKPGMEFSMWLKGSEGDLG
jgi:hypothetical protein